jgi:SAM-dependent methyltransferase
MQYVPYINGDTKNKIFVMNKRDYYLKRKRKIWEKYWKDNDGTDILRPNGFKEYPEEIYNIFLNLIDRDGKIIDLGCGNGLLLKHIITRSKYKLIPYGVDFIEESIEQAKNIILPEYAQNFTVANIVDYEMGENEYDFILFDPYSVHHDDLRDMIEKIYRACKEGGKIIFYTYRDVLMVLRIIYLIKFRWISWVGDLLPKDVKRNLDRRDYKKVSIGILYKK